MRLPLLAVLTAALLAAGCSDDADQPDDEPSFVGTPIAGPPPEQLRDGLALLYTGDDPDDEIASHGECFADALLAAVPVAELEVAGLVVDGRAADAVPVLDATTAEAWVDASESCAPYVEVSTRAFTAQSKGRIDADAYAACFADAIEPDRIRDALVASLGGRLDDPAVTELSTAQADCARGALPPD